MLDKLIGMSGAGLLGVLLTVSGCSYGVVQDKETNEFLGGAQITSRSVILTSTGPVELSTGFQQARTWSASDPGSNGGTGSWYLNPYAAAVLDGGDATTLFVPEGWTRFAVTRSGYDPRAFFRNHLYRPCDASTHNPYSAGAYPYNPLAPTTSGSCAMQAFQLSSSATNYIKDPDMIVDPRSIRDAVYTTGLADCDYHSNTCFRLSVGTANVGAGDLWLTAPSGQNNVVTQHRFRRNSGQVDTLLQNAVFVHDGHDHLHLAAWTNLRLRKITPACQYEVDAAECPVVGSGAKISFCLMDTDEFDTGSAYQPNGTYFCTETDGIISQGISSGKMDIYGKSLSGQMIPTDGLASGKYWLEVEVNPENRDGSRTVIESDYENNISRTIVEIP